MTPIDGTYKLQCWGAQGGGWMGSPGRGGYADGEYATMKSSVLYICVGHYGITNAKTYNNSPNSVVAFPHGSSGGGATSITKTNRGELKNFISNKDEVLIVAGGGGACEWKGTGGAGGGLNGIDGIPNETNARKGTGGTPTTGGITGRISGDTASNGSFGAGGYGEAYSAEYGGIDYGAQGGGGWYGGGGASYAGAAGGGSSYIGGVSNGSTKAGNNSTMPSLSGGTETGHAGDGECVITQIKFN